MNNVIEGQAPSYKATYDYDQSQEGNTHYIVAGRAHAIKILTPIWQLHL